MMIQGSDNAPFLRSGELILRLHKTAASINTALDLVTNFAYLL